MVKLIMLVITITAMMTPIIIPTSLLVYVLGSIIGSVTTSGGIGKVELEAFVPSSVDSVVVTSSTRS